MKDWLRKVLIIICDVSAIVSLLISLSEVLPTIFPIALHILGKI